MSNKEKIKYGLNPATTGFLKAFSKNMLVGP